MSSAQASVDRFYCALNAHDLDAVRACVHPEFEMVVPQKPARGFTGGDREVENMRLLFDAYPDLVTTVVRCVEDGDEVWTEMTAHASGLEMAGVVIWTVDPVAGTVTRGRYYTEPVDRDTADIAEFMRTLVRAPVSVTTPTRATPGRR